MRLGLRAVFLAGAIGCTLLAAGYFTQQPWALATWPWGEGRFGNVFVASILMAIAAPLAWIGISAQFGGTAGGFCHLAVMLGGIASVF